MSHVASVNKFGPVSHWSIKQLVAKRIVSVFNHPKRSVGSVDCNRSMISFSLFQTCSFSADGKLLASASDDQTVRVLMQPIW